MHSRGHKNRAWWWNAGHVAEITRDGSAPDCPISGKDYDGGNGTAVSPGSNPVPFGVPWLGGASKEQAMEWKIPEPLKMEHSELHEELIAATKEGGRVGAAAQEVATLLHPHFIREEEFALPPLGLLADLVKGTLVPEMADVLALTDRLEAELDGMLAEHKQIVAALSELVAAAKAENKPRYLDFAEKLILHARTEEEVLYPAALIVGRYIRLSLGK